MGRAGIRGVFNPKGHDLRVFSVSFWQTKSVFRAVGLLEMVVGKHVTVNFSK